MAVNAAVSAAPRMRRTLTNTFCQPTRQLLLVHVGPGGHQADGAIQAVGQRRCFDAEVSKTRVLTTTTRRSTAVQILTARSTSAKVRQATRP